MNERTIFMAALDIEDSAERCAYLDESCRGNADLRKRVEALLDSHEQAIGFLNSPPPGIIDSADTDNSLAVTESAGETIGPYKLLQQIGEGGMGVVFMAEQTHPLQRTVALKIIKPGMDTRQVIARFEAERQAVAMMDHPNIAKVLDAGTTESGRPYFVMELVKGVPITKYCDEKHLPLRDRLLLFIQVCQAVQHAHQKGVIHRDIKPNNVLVAEYDDQAVPKVIDFGVAKATAQRLTERTMFTEYGQLVGTMEYMSPEQAKLNQLDIDTRSDIYSLGVLLYELLAGSTPFEGKRLREAAFDEMLRIIREEEPQKPSTRLSTNAQLSSIAANRDSEPKKLGGLVKGELDWIAMKALEKDRNRRYETANGLAAEIQRYLNDEPVQACPPSAAYRFRKLAQRNKVALVTTAVVAAALILGTVISTWQAVRATRAEGLAAERLKAETEARQAADDAQKQALSERDQTQRRLFDARLAQARTRRASRQPGQRFNSWQALTEAAQIARDLELDDAYVMELRNEAIACLALADLQLVKKWEGWPPGSAGHVAFDANLERYARSDQPGNVIIARVSDDQQLVRLPGPGQPAMFMEFSPNGDSLAVLHNTGAEGGESTDFRVWDWKRREILFQPALPVANSAMAFSYDGHHLALGNPDGTITINDGTNDTEMKRLSFRSIPIHLAFDPGGTKLAVSIDGHAVEVRDIGTGNLLCTLSHPMDVSHVAWHPDGVLLAAACMDRQVYLWNAETARQLSILQGHQSSVVGVAFSPDGKLLHSCGWDGINHLWDPWTGSQLVSFPGGYGFFSRDGRRLASQRGGLELGLWDVTSSTEYRALSDLAKTGPGYNGGGISPDGRWLAMVNSHGIGLWDLKREREMTFLPIGSTVAAVFHPSGDELISYGQAGLHRWPLQATRDTLRLGPPNKLSASKLAAAGSPPQRLALDRVGRNLAVVWGGGGHGGASVIDLENPVGTAPHLDHGNAAFVAVSPEGDWVATGTWNGDGVKVWETHTGNLVQHLIPDVRIASVAFSPDGRWLVTSTEIEVGFWEVGSWQLNRQIRREPGLNLGVAFAADAKLLAIMLSPNVVQLVDPATARPFAKLQAPGEGHVALVGFTPDGSQLVVHTTAGSLHVWDLRPIRMQLKEIGLDWDLPSYPPPAAHNDITPVRIDVDLGEFKAKE